MKKWVVRFVSLLVFNVLVLLVVGWLTPARVGWAALWAGIVLTALVIWIKPLVENVFRSIAAKRGRAGEKLVELLIAFAVALLVWIATVLFTGVSIGGGLFGAFWGYVLPPVILLIGWAVYDAIDDRVESHAGALYDRATGGRANVPTPPPGAAGASPGASGRRGPASATGSAPPAVPPAPEAAAGRRELNDGLTDEQRRMLDELG